MGHAQQDSPWGNSSPGLTGRAIGKAAATLAARGKSISGVCVVMAMLLVTTLTPYYADVQKEIYTFNFSNSPLTVQAAHQEQLCSNLGQYHG